MLVAEKTFKGSRKLLEVIIDYYVKEKIPAIEQFDIILVNNRCVVYNVRPNSYVSIGNERTLLFMDTGNMSIAFFLYELNKMMYSEPSISENAMKIYLDSLLDTEFSKEIIVHFYDDLNKKWIEMESKYNSCNE